MMTPTLSPREYEILLACAEGGTVEQISADLGISIGTVYNHTRAIRNKLGARSMAQAVAHAYHYGIFKARG